MVLIRKWILPSAKKRSRKSFYQKDGFRGDGVADLRHHGGLDRAVCVYPHEHYSRWQQEFNNPLPELDFRREYNSDQYVGTRRSYWRRFPSRGCYYPNNARQDSMQHNYKERSISLPLKRMVEIGSRYLNRF